MQEEHKEKINVLMKKPSEAVFEGEQITSTEFKDQFVGRKIIIRQVEIRSSDKYKEGGEYAHIQFEYDDILYATIIGAEAVVEALKYNVEQGNLPFMATLIERKSAGGWTYYTLE